MSTPKIIHVLDKIDYSKHCLVHLPQVDLNTLAPSTLRLRTRLIGLTTNNLTYARLGQYMGWYDIYPLPPETPVPYNDTDTYGRIAAWGYAEIVESTVPGVPHGQTLYGYLPISTGVETIRVEFAEHKGKQIGDQVIALDKHRQHLWKIYNRYQIRAPLGHLERTIGANSLGWDALMQSLFGTAYNLNKFAFAWDEENRIHPSGAGEWTAQDADLRNVTVIILNASGKTGMSFAYALRQNRPQKHQPHVIIGVGSPASAATIERSGLYDKVVLNTAHEATRSFIESSGSTRTVFLDFGARSGAADAWHDTLSASRVPYTRVTVGGEVKVLDAEAAMNRFANRAAMNIANASLLREKGIAVGGEAYFAEFHAAFDEFKTKVAALKLVWSEGLDAWQKGWDALCRDEVGADTGLIYRI